MTVRESPGTLVDEGTTYQPSVRLDDWPDARTLPETSRALQPGDTVRVAITGDPASPTRSQVRLLGWDNPWPVLALMLPFLTGLVWVALGPWGRAWRLRRTG